MILSQSLASSLMSEMVPPIIATAISRDLALISSSLVKFLPSRVVIYPRKRGGPSDPLHYTPLREGFLREVKA
jgi:hypothetical protein